MRLVVLIASFAMTGCALLTDKQTLQDSGFWPSQTKRFCYVRGKLDREKRKVAVGIGCKF